MTGKDKLLQFYDNEPDISILVRFVNGVPIGRSILWRNVKGA
jgi:hypothetical protein